MDTRLDDLRERFSNNAEGTLAAGIGYFDEQIVLTKAEDAQTFAYLGGKDFQRATISDPSLPGVYEIVLIRGVVGATLTVVRSVETDDRFDWSAGAKISSRVTAGMLDRFVQLQQVPNQLMPAIRLRDGLVVNGRSSSLTEDIQQISGWPVLQRITAKPTSDLTRQDINMSHEAIGGTRLVNLGDVQAWNANASYGGYAVMTPASPDGFQYVFEPLSDYYGPLRTPPSDGSGYIEDAISGDQWNPDVVGRWLPTPMPVALTQYLGNIGGCGLILSEVGFICSMYGEGSAPSVSIGTEEEPARFVSNAPLSQITGGGHVQRFPISAGGELVRNLKFTQTSPTTGDFVGRFYWRGAMVQFA